MKKCISMLLAILMMLTIIPTAFADSTYSQPCVVDYFNSFNGFVKTSGTVDTPDGFVPFLYTNRYAYGLSSTTTDSDGTNTYLKFGNTANTNSAVIMMPFDETIRTGKLRVSFDMKIENPLELYRFYLYGHDNRKNDNPLDLMHQYEVEQDKKDEKGNPVLDENDKPIKEKVTKTDYAYSNLFDIGITESGSLCLRGSNKDSQKIAVANNIDSYWNKYDMELDFDNKTIKLSLNGGTPITANLNYNGLKSLYFFYTPGNAASKDAKAADSTLVDKNSPVYMDNLFIKHYPSGAYDNTEMVVDYAGRSVATENATIDVAFSEASGTVNESNDVNIENKEFVAQNVVDGTEVEPTKVSRIYDPTNAAAVIRLTFTSLPAGTYKIVCKDASVDGDSLYKGFFTEKTPTDSNTFSTVGTAQNVQEQNILVEDDFENYTGGIPANAESIDGTKSHWLGEINAATGEDGGTALAISEHRVIYQLPYALTGDRFTYEFDVNHTDGRWYTGVLTADAFSGKKTLSKDNYDAVIAGKATDNDKLYSDDLQTYKNKSNAIGCAGYGEDASKVQYVTYRQAWVEGAVSGLSCEKEVWNHVKVVVDLNAATYTITINDQTPQTVNLNPDRFRPTTRYMKKTVNGVEKWVKTWDYGIKAVSLGCYGDKKNSDNTILSNPTVLYDNFKVYTDNSYNAYQDFDAVERTGRTDKAQSAGWIMQLYPYTSKHVTADGEGINYSETTNAGDKSLKIDDLNASFYSYQFDRPIAENTPFEMEFDIKGDSTNTKQQYNFNLLTKEQLYSTYENSSVKTISAEAIDGTKGLLGTLDDSGSLQLTKAEQGKLYSSSVIFATRSLDKNDGKDNVRVAKYDGTRNWVDCKDDARWLAEDGKTEIPFDIIDKWAHIKLSGYPKDGKMAFVLSITSKNDDGTPKTITSQEFVSAIPSTTEFAAFGINPVDPQSAETGIVYLDNFTVKETNPVSKAYVTGVNAVDVATGERANLKSDGLRPNGDSIEISFSESISEDTISNIKIYQGNPVKYIDTTATLSADKKTVTLTPKSIPTVGEKYMLEIPQTVKTAAASNLSIVKPKAVAFTINNKTGTAELKVEDFRLYKYYAAGDNNGVAYAANWVPVADTELKDLTANDKFKFIAKGYNTGDTTQLWLGRATKDPTTTLLTNFDNQTADAPYGKFELSLPATKTADGEEGFTMENVNGSLETYLWESTGLRPLCGKYVFSVTKTPTTDTTETTD